MFSSRHRYELSLGGGVGAERACLVVRRSIRCPRGENLRKYFVLRGVLVRLSELCFFQGEPAPVTRWITRSANPAYTYVRRFRCEVLITRWDHYKRSSSVSSRTVSASNEYQNSNSLLTYQVYIYLLQCFQHVPSVAHAGGTDVRVIISSTCLRLE